MPRVSSLAPIAAALAVACSMTPREVPLLAPPARVDADTSLVFLSWSEPQVFSANFPVRPNRLHVEFSQALSEDEARDIARRLPGTRVEHLSRVSMTLFVRGDSEGCRLKDLMHALRVVPTVSRGYPIGHSCGVEALTACPGRRGGAC